MAWIEDQSLPCYQNESSIYCEACYALSNFEKMQLRYFTGEDRAAGKALTISSRAYKHSSNQSHYIEVAQEVIFMEQNWAEFGPVGNTEKENILGRS